MEKRTNGTVRRSWHLVDVKGQILGRVSTKIAKLLMGKDKPEFVPYLDQGDYAVVVNAKKIKITGKKETDKVYYRHSGYPGGLKSETLGELRKRLPEEIVRRAVKGMLPKNKLGARMITRLHIFADDKHPYQNKFRSKSNGERK